jgi:phosphohistidine phosphatase SixA
LAKGAAIKQAPRRIPLAQRKEVEDEIDKMLDNNVIVPSHSPWVSPIVVVRTRHGYIKIGLEVKACFNILKNLHKN